MPRFVRKSRETVESVVKAFLCTSCGVCAGICPKRSIRMQIDPYGVYVPSVDSSTCNSCGICLRVCPGHEFDYARHHRRLHGGSPEHISLGPCLGAFAGYSTDDEVLARAQSGGLVSTLLVYCLENGVIDGAVVTRWSKTDPFRPETYIARSRNEVLDAVGSKYSPVPAARVARELLAKSGRYAFVGTSCQIQGMRKAEEVYPRLARRVTLYIGLHCLGVKTYHFHDQLLHKLNLTRESISSFRSRDKAWRGWPGDTRIVDQQGHVHNLDHRESRIWPRSFFANWRCQLCFDKANEFSDVSFGDCRIPAIHSRLENAGYDLQSGLSEIVIRTERAQILLTDFFASSRVRTVPVDLDAVASSIGVSGKKIGIARFQLAAKLLAMGAPSYGVLFLHPEVEQSMKWRLLKLWSVVHSMRYALLFRLMRFRATRSIMKRISHRALGRIDGRSRRCVDWSVFSPSVAISLNRPGSKPR